jgi:hypothetical protein
MEMNFRRESRRDVQTLAPDAIRGTGSKNPPAPAGATDESRIKLRLSPLPGQWH